MKLSEHKALKTEILALSPKEKDKLLLRLIARDKVLTERLHFSLLEDEHDLKERVNALKETILNDEQNLKKMTGKEVLVNLRKTLRLINHFFKVTRAGFEEVELRLFLFNHTVTEFKKRSFSSFKNDDQLFAAFFVKSTAATLKKFEKLHEDLQFDLKEELNKVLTKINSGYMASWASDLDLPKQL